MTARFRETLQRYARVIVHSSTTLLDVVGIVTRIVAASLSFIPLAVGLVALAVILYVFWDKTPTFVNLADLPGGVMSETEKQAVSMASELNKFLISLVTLMFGAVAFFLMHFRREIQILPVNLGFLAALILLGLTYFFGFLTYSQLTAELSQNALGLIPGKSRTLYYLEMEFLTFCGATATMLSIFFIVLFGQNKEGTSPVKESDKNGVLHS